MLSTFGLIQNVVADVIVHSDIKEIHVSRAEIKSRNLILLISNTGKQNIRVLKVLACWGREPDPADEKQETPLENCFESYIAGEFDSGKAVWSIPVEISPRSEALNVRILKIQTTED